jgi:shikimate kinase
VAAAPQSIVLIGFMGTGKSSVGLLLSRHCGWPRVETDELVEQELGMTISEIFAQLGEPRFREVETEVLRKLNPSQQAVIVTGGGVVLRAQNVARLRKLGTVVCLSADLPTLQKRLSQDTGRPLVEAGDSLETIARLLEARKRFYAEAADFVVDTTVLTCEQVAQHIHDELQVGRRN